MLKPIFIATMVALAVPAAGVVQAAAPVENMPQGDTGAGSPGQAASRDNGAGRQVAVVPLENVTQFRASATLGSKVTDASGKEVGRVDDLLFNQDGSLAAVVVSVGGLFGIGGKPVAVAADKAHIVSNANGKAVELEISQADLAAAPAFRTQEDIKSDLDSKAGGSVQ